MNDLRHALRRLASAPGFTAAAAGTLALGIAATTIVFSLLNAVVLRPLPYRDPSRLALVWEIMEDGKPWRVSPATFRAWREGSRALESAAAFGAASKTLTGRGDPVALSGARVTANYFRVLGVSPILGRDFADAEGRAGGPRAVMLGHALWSTRFGSDPAIVGRPVVLDGDAYTVVGVAPPAPFPTSPMTTGEVSFRPGQQEFFVPGALDGTDRPGGRSYVLGVVARLRPGVSARAAGDDVARVSRQLHASDPASRAVSARLAPLPRATAGAMGPALWLLLAAVGGVLAIGCANVTGLALARGEGRRREIAIRAALGADAWRVVSPILLESAAVAAAGGLAGIAAAVWGLPALVASAPAEAPRLSEARLDPVVLAFTVLVTVACGIASGILPALLAVRRARRTGVADAARATASAGARRALGTLVVAETALAVLLVAGALLLTKSLLLLQGVELGFRANGVLVSGVSVPRARYDSPAKVAAFYGALVSRLRARGDVAAAALAYNHPLEANWLGSVALEPRAGEPIPAGVTAWFRAVGDGYFRTMGVPLAAGREFEPADDARRPGVALVNEAFARRYLGGDAIGRRFTAADASMWWGDPNLPSRFEIVGVVHDVRFLGPAKEAEPAYYLSIRQFPIEDMRLLVRAVASPSLLPAAVRASVRELDSSLPVSNVRRLEEIEREALATPRLSMRLMVFFGSAALSLAGVGVYGLLAYLVALRRREIGIRVALGAGPSRVVTTVVSETMRLSAAGAALGIGGALILSPALRGFLFGVAPGDPETLLAAPALLAAAAAVASAVPAWRAVRTDPTRVLRAE